MASIEMRGENVSVRWREGGSERKRTFTKKAHGSTAEARRAAKKLKMEVERRKESGDLGYYRGLNSTLSEIVGREWWPRHAELELESKTLQLYSWLWNKHILPYLGDYKMREIRAGVIRDWKIELQRKDVGAPTIRKAMSLLQGIYRWAAEDELIPPENPVQVVKKPSAPRQIKIKVFSPHDIERIRAELPSLGDKTFVSVLGYSGLRPEEALALTWDHVRDNTLLVERKVVDGDVIETTKTGKTRTVDLLEPLANDLDEWRKVMGGQGSDLVFPRLGTSRPWRRHDYENWRKRVFSKSLANAGLSGRIYDLRHSFASLLIQAGHRSPYVAEQLGHTVATSTTTYQHVFEEVGDPGQWLDPEARITQARKEVK